jgi:hypothetical protein
MFPFGLICFLSLRHPFPPIQTDCFSVFFGSAARPVLLGQAGCLFIIINSLYYVSYPSPDPSLANCLFFSSVFLHKHWPKDKIRPFRLGSSFVFFLISNLMLFVNG